ncbi:MAG: outer membrane beta-barrel protein [Nonlabens sp.]
MKIFITVVALLVMTCTLAQTENGWGLKGGLNYSGVGDLKQGTMAIVENPDSNFGFHAGVFNKYDIGPINLRVELSYASISSDFNDATFKLRKVDLPVLAGFSVVGPLEFFIGPAAQVIVSADIDDISFKDIEDRITVGAQAGFSFGLGNFGVDVRYERGFTASEFNFISDRVGAGAFSLDARPEQIILSVSVIL